VSLFNSNLDCFIELRLARLALDPNNSPAWEVPDQELMRPMTKMPLFVGAHPITSSSKQAEVTILITHLKVLNFKI